MRLLKGHGTQNDFVLLPDYDGDTDVPATAVAALCDRRAGIGGDGLIRVVRSAALDTSLPGAADALADGAEWFMDYRNGDGSIAEMCGNGSRVFAHYLVQAGLADATGVISVGTRAGTKHVRAMANPFAGEAVAAKPPWYSVDMGSWRFPLPHDQGFDSQVDTVGIQVERPALSVDMGNPHTVVALAGLDELSGARLYDAPRVEPIPANGTNVEYIVVDAEGDDGIGRLDMRVHERGVGETYACGTGACASALAARFWAGPTGPKSWYVTQPGGTVRIDIADDRVVLSGPAVLVATVEPSPELLAAAGLG